MTARRPAPELPHKALPAHAVAARAGRLDRREFLALATALGATTAAAYALLGLSAPARAQTSAPASAAQGGTLRMLMQG